MAHRQRRWSSMNSSLGYSEVAEVDIQVEP